IVKLLLAWDDIQINIKASDGVISLSWAASGGYEAVVKLLLAQEDIGINLKNNNSRTTLSKAMFSAKYLGLVFRI
ncbi:hypothetical protein AOQ84DRAFT_292587, partial [Glonium stellatum]